MLSSATLGSDTWKYFDTSTLLLSDFHLSLQQTPGVLAIYLKQFLISWSDLYFLDCLEPGMVPGAAGGPANDR